MSGKRFINYYKVLGVKQDANLISLRNAYLRRAKQMHPDHGGSVAKMQLLNRAYEVLRNPQRRAMYDQAHFASLRPLTKEERDDIFLDSLFYEKVVSQAARGWRSWYRRHILSVFKPSRRPSLR